MDINYMDVKTVEEARVMLMQYQNLREHFQEVVKHILGENYYNMGMDVYVCDELACEDIKRAFDEKGCGWLWKLLNKN